MREIWAETAAVFRTGPATRPTAHLAGHGAVTACCGAWPDELPPGHWLTPDQDDVTCHQWLAWRSAIRYVSDLLWGQPQEGSL